MIYNKKRVFGYDNLKEWHLHPYSNPESHIPCEEPPLEKIIEEFYDVYKKIIE